MPNEPARVSARVTCGGRNSLDTTVMDADGRFVKHDARLVAPKHRVVPCDDRDATTSRFSARVTSQDLNAEAGRSNGEAGELIELTGNTATPANETEPSYFRGKAIFTAPAAPAGATHSAVLKVFAVARAAPVCQAPSVRNIFRAHVVVVGLHATCVVAAACTSTTVFPTL